MNKLIIKFNKKKLSFRIVWVEDFYSTFNWREKLYSNEVISVKFISFSAILYPFLLPPKIYNNQHHHRIITLNKDYDIVLLLIPVAIFQLSQECFSHFHTSYDDLFLFYRIPKLLFLSSSFFKEYFSHTQLYHA